MISSTQINPFNPYLTMAKDDEIVGQPSPLQLAIQQNDQEQVYHLLEQGTAINFAPESAADDEITLFIDSLSVSGPSHATPEDILKDAIEKAFVEHRKAEQLILLEKLAIFYLEIDKYQLAALYLNSALEGSVEYAFSPTYRARLIDKLEQLENRFLREQFNIITDKKGYLASYRADLTKIRQPLSSLLTQGRHQSLAIQAVLTAKFKWLLVEIITLSMEQLGPPPTSFAVIGLGSMSRNEMSPFSDVEFGFLIEKEDDREYFRKLARLLEIRITNLGETQYVVYGKNQKSFCKKGFSMDLGGLSPLGQQEVYELIGTPEELACYESEEWEQSQLGAGTILINALRTPVYIMGHRPLLDEYQTQVNTILNRAKSGKDRTLREDRALQLLEGHLEEYDPANSMRKTNLRAFDVKRELCRPLQMIIEALSIYYNLDSYSTFERIEELTTNEILSPEGAKNLTYAFQIAADLRLRAQFFYGEEVEDICHADSEESTLSVSSPDFLLNSQDKDKLLFFFRVIFPFHRLAQEFIDGNRQSFRQSNFHDQAINRDARYSKAPKNYQELEFNYLTAAALDPTDQNNFSLGVVLSQTGNLRDALQYTRRALAQHKAQQGVSPDEKTTRYLILIGEICMELSRMDEACSYLTQAIEMSNNLNKGQPSALDRASKISLGLFYYRTGQITLAISVFQKALESNEKLPDKKEHEIYLLRLLIQAYLQSGLILKAEMLLIKMQFMTISKRNSPSENVQRLNQAALCFAASGRLGIAINNYTLALKILEKIFPNRPHPCKMTVLNNLGYAHESNADYEAAKNCFEKCLKLAGPLFNDSPNELTALALAGCGLAAIGLQKFADAIRDLEKALSIFKECFHEESYHIANVMNNLGAAHYNLCVKGESDRKNHLLKAIEAYHEAIDIRKKLFTNHIDIAIALTNLGLCYAMGKHFEEEKKNHVEALKMLLDLLPDQCNEHVAVVCNNLGMCCSKLEQLDEAIKFNTKALNIRKKLFKSHPNLIASLSNLGFIHSKKGNSKQALDYYKKALQMSQTLEHVRLETALLLIKMADIHQELKQIPETINYLKQALALLEQIFPNQNNMYISEVRRRLSLMSD